MELPKIGFLINLVSKKPLGDSSGYVDLIVGSGSRKDVRGSYDASISDNLSAKFSDSVKDGGEWGKALDFATKNHVADLGGKDSTSFRAAFSLQASENTTVDFILDSKSVDSSLLWVLTTRSNFIELRSLQIFLLSADDMSCKYVLI